MKMAITSVICANVLAIAMAFFMYGAWFLPEPVQASLVDLEPTPVEPPKQLAQARPLDVVIQRIEAPLGSPRLEDSNRAASPISPPPVAVIPRAPIERHTPAPLRPTEQDQKPEASNPAPRKPVQPPANNPQEATPAPGRAPTPPPMVDPQQQARVLQRQIAVTRQRVAVLESRIRRLETALNPETIEAEIEAGSRNRVPNARERQRMQLKADQLNQTRRERNELKDSIRALERELATHQRRSIRR